MASETKKILTVISNFNEEAAIFDTINDVKNHKTIETDILVIDNCSSDSSIDIVRSLQIDYIKLPVNSGGSAGVIKTAFAYAFYKGYDIYCHMDGDNQHIASELVRLVQPILNEEVDAVTGSRFINKKGFQANFVRRQGIILFSKIMTWIAGREYTDITSGFRAYNKRAISFFANHFKQEIETVIQFELVMHYAGLKGKDVPVLMRSRTTGKSEINFVNALKFPVYNLISFIGTIIQKIK